MDESAAADDFLKPDREDVNNPAEAASAAAAAMGSTSVANHPFAAMMMDLYTMPSNNNNNNETTDPSSSQQHLSTGTSSQTPVYLLHHSLLQLPNASNPAPAATAASQPPNSTPASLMQAPYHIATAAFAAAAAGNAPPPGMTTGGSAMGGAPPIMGGGMTLGGLAAPNPDFSHQPPPSFYAIPGFVPHPHSNLTNAPPSGAPPAYETTTTPHFLQQPHHHQPTYVNAKQYQRIMKRRETRQALELYFQRQRDKKAAAAGTADSLAAGGGGRISGKRRDYQHESRHKHAMKRPRGPHGRFLTGDELETFYRENPDRDPRNGLGGADSTNDGTTLNHTNAAVETTNDTCPSNIDTTVNNDRYAAEKEDAVVTMSAATLPVSPIALSEATRPLLLEHTAEDEHEDPLLTEAAEALTGGHDHDAGEYPAILSIGI